HLGPEAGQADEDGAARHHPPLGLVAHDVELPGVQLLVDRGRAGRGRRRLPGGLRQGMLDLALECLWTWTVEETEDGRRADATAGRNRQGRADDGGTGENEAAGATTFGRVASARCPSSPKQSVPHTLCRPGPSRMLICGACERELPEGSYGAGQRARRQSIRRCDECRRCGECVAAGNQLVLMKKGRTRSEEDDCPICQLPLPLDGRQSKFKVCCMTRVCDGCILAALKRGMNDCPFCRAPRPKASQIVSMVEKRVDAGDPVAMWHLGKQYADGSYGVTKDVTRAIELYERAAVLGTKHAFCSLGCLYHVGTDVEKDPAKTIQHWEAAAIKGDTLARCNLGNIEDKAGHYDIALQHYMIAAKMGHQDSLDNIKKMFVNGHASKADYAEALRGHHSAAEEMRSPDREEALAFIVSPDLPVRVVGVPDDEVRPPPRIDVVVAAPQVAEVQHRPLDFLAVREIVPLSLGAPNMPRVHLALLDDDLAEEAPVRPAARGHVRASFLRLLEMGVILRCARLRPR
ncbi:hypothetical protein THAOC_24573, partial [Thalassiosira oceanica]